MEHRAAFLYMTGSIPRLVDHINGDKRDNRWVNLRASNSSQNLQNQRMRRTNSSGLKGVSWHKQRQKWAAQIAFNGKHKSLGLYHCPLEAHAAYRKAARELFGEFANFG